MRDAENFVRDLRFPSRRRTTPEIVNLIRARDAEVAARAWDEGYDEGVQRGIGLERTGHLTTRRNELDPIPTNPYERTEPAP